MKLLSVDDKLKLISIIRSYRTHPDSGTHIDALYDSCENNSSLHNQLNTATKNDLEQNSYKKLTNIHPSEIKYVSKEIQSSILMEAIKNNNTDKVILSNLNSINSEDIKSISKGFNAIKLYKFCTHNSNLTINDNILPILKEKITNLDHTTTQFQDYPLYFQAASYAFGESKDRSDIDKLALKWMEKIVDSKLSYSTSIKELAKLTDFGWVPSNKTIADTHQNPALYGKILNLYTPIFKKIATSFFHAGAETERVSTVLERFFIDRNIDPNFITKEYLNLENTYRTHRVEENINAETTALKIGKAELKTAEVFRTECQDQLASLKNASNAAINQQTNSFEQLSNLINPILKFHGMVQQSSQNVMDQTASTLRIQASQHSNQNFKQDLENTKTQCRELLEQTDKFAKEADLQVQIIAEYFIPKLQSLENLTKDQKEKVENLIKRLESKAGVQANKNKAELTESKIRNLHGNLITAVESQKTMDLIPIVKNALQVGDLKSYLFEAAASAKKLNEAIQSNIHVPLSFKDMNRLAVESTQTTVEEALVQFEELVFNFLNNFPKLPDQHSLADLVEIKKLLYDLKKIPLIDKDTQKKVEKLIIPIELKVDLQLLLLNAETALSECEKLSKTESNDIGVLNKTIDSIIGQEEGLKKSLDDLINKNTLDSTPNDITTLVAQIEKVVNLIKQSKIAFAEKIQANLSLSAQTSVKPPAPNNAVTPQPITRAEFLEKLKSITGGDTKITAP